MRFTNWMNGNVSADVGTDMWANDPAEDHVLVCLSSCFVRVLQYIWKQTVTLQDKETYCWPIRESLKTMLSWGWSIDRIREGDSVNLHNKPRRISQASQVYMNTTHSYICSQGTHYGSKGKVTSYIMLCVQSPTAFFWRSFSFQSKTHWYE